MKQLQGRINKQEKETNKYKQITPRTKLHQKLN